MRSVQKKQIKYLPVSQKYFQKQHFHSDGFSPSTAWSPIAVLQAQPLLALSGSDSFRYSLNGSLSIKSGIITSRKKNGCLMAKLWCTEVLRNSERPLNIFYLQYFEWRYQSNIPMVSVRQQPEARRRKEILVIKACQWMGLFITLRFLFLDCGRSTFSEKAIQEQRQCSLSSIWEHLGSRQRMIFLQTMRDAQKNRGAASC